MPEKILLVDDDYRVLEAMRRNLRSRYAVKTAAGALPGLRTLEAEGPFAVVVSDMRMPILDGSRFLAKVLERAPDTVQIMLTGQSDLELAIRAVNQGKLFRFLTKPCSTEVLSQALDAGLKQYRLVKAERDLLEKTLGGSIKLLTEMLELVNPVAFGRTSRIRTLVGALLPDLGAENAWQLELTVLLSQVGLVAVPGEILGKADRGEELNDQEQEVWNQHPRVGRDLVAHIPRLEAVAENIAWQLKRFDGQGPPNADLRGEDIPLGARVLKAVTDYDGLVQRGADPWDALAEMDTRAGWYDRRLLDLLKTCAAKAQGGYEFRAVGVKELRTGMILTAGIRNTQGQLIVGKGMLITATMLARILNFTQWQKIDEPLSVLVETGSKAGVKSDSAGSQDGRVSRLRVPE